MMSQDIVNEVAILFSFKTSIHTYIDDILCSARFHLGVKQLGIFVFKM